MKEPACREIGRRPRRPPCPEIAICLSTRPKASWSCPGNFNEWIYAGSPTTPHDLNDGKAGFLEFHNVYIEPGSCEIHKRTNVFPEGTILFKELQLVLDPRFPDGSRTETSGRGFFPGALNGADVIVKDSKRYAQTKGWGFYNFNHSEPKAKTAKVAAARPVRVLPRERCQEGHGLDAVLPAAGQIASRDRCPCLHPCDR